MANHTEEKDLEQNTVAELKEMADAEGVDVPYNATKAEIIKAIEKNRKAKGKAGEEEEELQATPTEEHPEINPLALTGPVVTLPLAGVTSDAYGVGRKYNVTLADIQGLGAVLQANFLLENLPAASIMQLVRVKHSQAAVGPSVTACTAQVGDGTNNWGSALNMFVAPSDTALQTAQLTATNLGPYGTIYPVYLTLIATGGNLGVFTAGAVSVWLRWTVLL